MVQQRYDQRVAALVEVRGGPDDWAEAERCFEARGWPVRSRHALGDGPTRGVLDPDLGSKVFAVEVRLLGAARGCARGAAHRLRKALHGARLEAYVRRVEPITRELESISRWQVSRVPPRFPGDTPGWRRRLRRLALRLGRYDTDTMVFGRPAQALRLARVNNPVGYDHTVPRAVRPLDGRWRNPSEHWPEQEENRRLLGIARWLLATLFSVVFAHTAVGFARWAWVLGAIACAVTTIWRGARLRRTKRLGGAVAATILLAFTATLVIADKNGDRRGWSPTEAIVVVTVVVVVSGLWLLVRQWSWGEWVAWAIPLVVTLAASSFLTAGSVLHALYADGFGLSPDDLHVPAIWQIAATGKLLTLLSLVMTVPAAWGYARHYHLSVATPGENFNFLIYVLLLVLFFGGSTGLALNSAQSAVDRTIAAARHGIRPPPYFGIRPSWTCVEPVVSVAQLSGEGPHLRPDRPYIAFGVANGNAVLWDSSANKPLKLPASQVRLVPVTSARQPCGLGKR